MTAKGDGNETPAGHRRPGVTAELVGDGVIDPDEDQTLQAEIEALIERHGAAAIAEDFIRFE